MIKIKKNTSVHIRNPLSLLWTCMSTLVRGGSLLIYYARCMEEPLFRGILEERGKKMYLKLLQGRGDTVNKFKTCTLEGEGVTFCCDSSKTYAKHLSYNKIF